ncbi:MAG: hypothetical protein SPL73_02880 [Cyanobacteriota bacterium]|nr:hypothetical protein [Cyanobacteriota bacterium]MDY6363814.1 hypothetical protein [Cyanobacteriota bacterium]MDY6383523.1 hypothetical protein [Cyanobacteriota bacterium]
MQYNVIKLIDISQQVSRMKTFKKTILIDLDGVLNIYMGDYVENCIPPMKCGADILLEKLSKDYDVVIHTTRNLLLASEWIIENKLDRYVKNVTNVKEPCFCQLMTDV